MPKRLGKQADGNDQGRGRPGRRLGHDGVARPQRRPGQADQRRRPGSGSAPPPRSSDMPPTVWRGASGSSARRCWRWSATRSRPRRTRAGSSSVPRRRRRKHGWLLMLVNTGVRQRDRGAPRSEALQQRQVDGFLYATMYHRESSTLPADSATSPTVLLDARCDRPARPFGRAGRGRRRTQPRPRLLLATGTPPDRAASTTSTTSPRAEVGSRATARPCATPGSTSTRGPRGARAELRRRRRFRCRRARCWIRTTGPRRSSASTTGWRWAPTRPPPSSACASPTDLSVVGFDNQELIADGLRPGLTTVALPHYEMGAWAVETLIHRIEHPDAQPEQVRADHARRRARAP